MGSPASVINKNAVNKIYYTMKNNFCEFFVNKKVVNFLQLLFVKRMNFDAKRQARQNFS